MTCGFQSWLPSARLNAEELHIPVKAPKWSPRLIFAGGGGKDTASKLIPFNTGM